MANGEWIARLLRLQVACNPATLPPEEDTMSEQRPTSDDLAERRCEPCRGGVPALAGDDLDAFKGGLDPGWEVIRDHHLIKQYQFPDFVTALAFVNRVGEMSEDQGHHPVIVLTWGEVTLKVWTHKIDGLTESDFVWAAKAERLHEPAGDGA
jgi:4a-hydroxytetrahydrobiopterin dehydratase